MSELFPPAGGFAQRQPSGEFGAAHVRQLPPPAGADDRRRSNDGDCFSTDLERRNSGDQGHRAVGLAVDCGDGYKRGRCAA